ncbi:MAG: FAD-dependent oxidoreductase [bacterium]|nr:FAD-dependent oxidoreductase [bacterium]
MKYDVLVIGGGISGTMAAMAACRNGATTLLIEQYGFLGGMLTTAGVGPMMTFHAGDKQVIQGITGELIDRLVAKGKSPGHIADTTGYTYSVTPFDAEGMKHELELMLLESGGRLLYHTMLADVTVEGDRLKHITVCNKAGLSELTARVFVDATGDADLSAWAGVECLSGEEIAPVFQPMTMNMKMAPVNIDKIAAYMKACPDEFPRHRDKRTLSSLHDAPRASIAGFVKTFDQAKRQGKITFQREDILFFETNNPGEVIMNTTRIHQLDPTNPWELTQAEIEGRKQVRELEQFLRRSVPGFEDAILLSSGPQVGARSSRQIQGLYTLTKEDVLTGRTFEDVVAHNGYPIDIHSPKGTGTQSEFLPWGEFYSIPYRCFINDRICNLITVGRCISATFEAQAALRTTPGIGAIGHAGGVAASLAARQNIPFTLVDVREIQQILLQQHAYLEC